MSQRDRFKVKTGGLIDMNSIKEGVSNVDDAYDTGIGTQFSAETNKRDEDDEMYNINFFLKIIVFFKFKFIIFSYRMKYIEDQLKKRKKKFANNNEFNSETHNKGVNYFSPEEAALQALPNHLRISSGHHSEEMLSNQMLSGIPEVDLGIE